MKVYALELQEPYENSVIEEVFETYEDAEAARLKMRPRKNWYVQEYDVTPASSVTQVTPGSDEG